MGIKQFAIDKILEDVSSRARVVRHASLCHEPSHDCSTKDKVTGGGTISDAGLYYNKSYQS